MPLNPNTKLLIVLPINYIFAVVIVPKPNVRKITVNATMQVLDAILYANVSIVKTEIKIITKLNKSNHFKRKLYVDDSKIFLSIIQSNLICTQMMFEMCLQINILLTFKFFP